MWGSLLFLYVMHDGCSVEYTRYCKVVVEQPVCQINKNQGRSLGDVCVMGDGMNVAYAGEHGTHYVCGP